MRTERNCSTRAWPARTNTPATECYASPLPVLLAGSDYGIGYSEEDTWCGMCKINVDNFLTKQKGMTLEEAKRWRRKRLTVTAERVSYEDCDEVRSVEASFVFANEVESEEVQEASKTVVTGMYTYHHRIRMSSIEHFADAEVRALASPWCHAPACLRLLHALHMIAMHRFAANAPLRCQCTC